MALGSLTRSQELTPDTITSPRDLHGLSAEELEAFCADVRRFLVDAVSETGGHIGANLGTVELSVALHASFDSPHDAIVWDTGHQGYTHKIVTGRADLFPTLNTYGGMNRFVSRSESVHDTIEASHAGTAISVGLGLALARKLDGDPHHVVSVVGDGSLAEGLALEGLNHAAAEETNLILVLNDNGYAISPGFGAIHDALQAGPFRAGALFKSLGLAYIGPVDGHDVNELMRAIDRAKRADRLPLVHVRTEKGHDWAPADEHPYRQHFSFPFDPATGAPRDRAAQAGAAPAETYPDVAARVVEEEMERDERVVCVTPSTIYATGLAQVFERFPERSFDPGMEEQHAMTMTVGLALGGKRPVVCYQSTFMQRAFDQLVHDVCFTNLPTLILSFRSGFAGYDNPTHHGIYDFAYLRGLPNLRVLYPKDRFEAERMVRDELRSLSGPTMVCMPYGPTDAFDPGALEEEGEALAAPEIVRAGKHLSVVCVGHQFAAAEEAVERLAARGVDAGLVNLRQLQPLPAEGLVGVLASTARVVTLEQAVLDGGVGSAIAALATDHGLPCGILRLGLPATFVEPGSNDELAAAYGLDADGILARIAERWPELGESGS